MDQERLDYADPECPPGRRGRGWLGPLAAVLLTLFVCPPLNRDQPEQMEVLRMKALVRALVARIGWGEERQDSETAGATPATLGRYSTGLLEHDAP